MLTGDEENQEREAGTQVQTIIRGKALEALTIARDYLKAQFVGYILDTINKNPFIQ